MVELAASIGLTLDAGQADVLHDGTAQSRNGQWLTRDVVHIEPRQNGKSLELEVRAFGGAYLLNEPLIVWTAHEFKTAHRSFTAMKERIDNYDHLRKRVKVIRSSTHATEIVLKNPTRVIAFLARSGGSGRGFAGVAPLFLDEAFALTPEQVAAIIFATSAAANPQVWYMSSAPLADSEVLRPLVKRGRRGAPGLTYYEWSAEGSIKDLSALIAQAKVAHTGNALGGELRERFFAKTAEANRAFNVRISEDTILSELSIVPAEQFLRERWGAFSELEEGGKIDPEQWKAIADPESRRDGEVAISVDISVSREWSAVGMYGMRNDGLGHVQLIDYRPGTDWVVEAIVKLREVLDPIAVGMARGTYASLKEKLKEKGFLRPEDRPVDSTAYQVEGASIHPPQRGDLLVMNGSDMAAACGGFIDGVRQGRMRHVPADQLDSSIRGAQTRVVGDTMAWARVDNLSEITPTVVVTEAKHVFEARINEVTDYDPAGDIF